MQAYLIFHLDCIPSEGDGMGNCTTPYLGLSMLPDPAALAPEIQQVRFDQYVFFFDSSDLKTMSSLSFFVMNWLSPSYQA